MQFKIHHKLIVWTWVQYIITSILMFHFFIIMESQSIMLNYIYAVFLIVNIFSFTAILDNQKYIMIVESLKSVIYAWPYLFPRI